MTKIKSDESDIIFRPPTSQDGFAVNQLIGRCPPLDTNSVYCNLLQCSHWSDTCVCAEQEGDLKGFISGYRIPEKADHLFVWQVAVDASARGQGLARRMLNALLEREANSDVRYIQTTINPDNDASWALFEGWADQLEAETKRKCLFDKEAHFGGRHDDEIMLTIGPIHQER